MVNFKEYNIIIEKCIGLNCSFISQEKLNEHLKLCMNYENFRAILPEKNKVNFIGDREDI